MEQESEGGFVAKPFDDILREDDGDSPLREPAGRPEPAAALEAVETGETAAPAEDKPKDDRPRDEAGRFAPKAADAPQQAAGSPPAAQNGPPQSVPASVLVEERRKWQARVRELEAQLTAPRPVPQPQQPPPAPEPPPEELLFQDPARFVQSLRQQQEEALLVTRLEMSAAIARQQPDYDQAEAALAEYAQSSPAAAREVRDALRAAPAPALWAYQAGKKLLEQRPESIEARINAEVERRMAERMQQQPATSSAPPPPPASLASVRSAAPRAQWAGPAPTNAIFGRQR